MKAILTKFVGPTNTRGARVTAWEPDGKRVSVSWDHSLDEFENFERAAYTLTERLGWEGELIGGSIRDGYAFVFIYEPKRRRR